MIKDKFGNSIEPGDIAVYAVTESKSAVLRIGKVIKIGTDNYGEDFFNVRSVDEWHNPPQLYSRATRVKKLKCVIVLFNHQVPEKYMNLLDKVEVK